MKKILAFDKLFWKELRSLTDFKTILSGDKSPLMAFSAIILTNIPVMSPNARATHVGTAVAHVHNGYVNDRPFDKIGHGHCYVHMVHAAACSKLLLFKHYGKRLPFFCPSAESYDTLADDWEAE